MNEDVILPSNKLWSPEDTCLLSPVEWYLSHQHFQSESPVLGPFCRALSLIHLRLFEVKKKEILPQLLVETGQRECCGQNEEFIYLFSGLALVSKLSFCR